MHRKIQIKENRGFTLVEVLITIAIIGIVSAITYPLLNINNQFTSRQFKESGQRNDVRVASTFLTDDIKYGKEVVVSEKQLEIKDNNNKTIRYYIKENPDNEKALVRERDGFNTFDKIQDVRFKLLNDKLVSVRLITDIENNKSIEFKITRLDFKLVRDPGEEPKDSLYDYLMKNHIFVFGGNLWVSGSVPVNGSSNNEGSIVIDNWTKTDVVFNGNNSIHMKNIYINKYGNKVKFTSSTKLGKTGLTDIIVIKGDVELNNGGASITGDRIFIDGNVTFNDSAKIYGKNIYINGNVKFNNWSAKLDVDQIYITGTVTPYGNAPNIDGDLRHVDEMLIPDEMEVNIPSLPLFHEDNWYSSKGYVSGGELNNGSKIFSNNYSFTRGGSVSTFDNVIIVSKGDITLNGNGWLKVTGLLFAPNGKVTFDGHQFEGVVIAKDGFHVINGGSGITYRNISNYIRNIEDFPLR